MAKPRGTTMADSLSQRFVVPGDKLDSKTTSVGSYSRGASSYASLCGHITSNGQLKPLCPSVVVPEKGSLVLCRVVSVGQAFAKVRIISVGTSVLREPLQAIIRREEVRAAEKDKVSLFNNFRPRDIVRARVLTLGEAHYYTLTTAENELGVVLAKSSHDSHMIPVSWCEMQCTLTGIREKRKVAKVINNIPLS